MYGKKPEVKKEEEEKPKRILFDVAHGETIAIDSDEFKDFRTFLAENNYEVYKLSQKPLNSDLIEPYTMLMIGAPKNATFTEEEIVELMKYLREGGAILIIHSAGGDQYNNTNLNAVASHLGYFFNADYMAHETAFEGDDFYATFSKGIALDSLTSGVRSIYTGNTCTMKINDASGAKKLVFSHEPWPESRICAVYGYYSLGRHLGLTSPDILKYIKRHDNMFFVQSILYWIGELRRESEFD